MNVPSKVDVELYDLCFVNVGGVDLGLDNVPQVLCEGFEVGPGHAGFHAVSVLASRLMELVGDESLSEF